MIVGIPLYDGVDMLDVTGPFEMLDWAGFDVQLAARTAGPIKCRSNMSAALTLLAPNAFHDAPQYDVLWVPGGEPDALARVMGDPSRSYLDFIIRQAEHARYVCSVCEGVLLLAAAGLLDGYHATTHWAFTECFGQFPKVKLVPGHPRYHLDRNRLTGGGISSGLDEALALIELLKGKAAAQDVQRTTQYYPKPPIDSVIPKPPSCPVPPVVIPPNG